MLKNRVFFAEAITGIITSEITSSIVDLDLKYDNLYHEHNVDIELSKKGLSSAAYEELTSTKMYNKLIVITDTESLACLPLMLSKVDTNVADDVIKVKTVGMGAYFNFRFAASDLIPINTVITTATTKTFSSNNSLNLAIRVLGSAFEVPSFLNSQPIDFITVNGYNTAPSTGSVSISTEVQSMESVLSLFMKIGDEERIQYSYNIEFTVDDINAPTIVNGLLTVSNKWNTTASDIDVTQHDITSFNHDLGVTQRPYSRIVTESSLDASDTRDMNLLSKELSTAATEEVLLIEKYDAISGEVLTDTELATYATSKITLDQEEINVDYDLAFTSQEMFFRVINSPSNSPIINFTGSDLISTLSGKDFLIHTIEYSSGEELKTTYYLSTKKNVGRLPARKRVPNNSVPSNSDITTNGDYGTLSSLTPSTPSLDIGEIPWYDQTPTIPNAPLDGSQSDIRPIYGINCEAPQIYGSTLTHIPNIRLRSDSNGYHIHPINTYWDTSRDTFEYGWFEWDEVSNLGLTCRYPDSTGYRPHVQSTYSWVNGIGYQATNRNIALDINLAYVNAKYGKLLPSKTRNKMSLNVDDFDNMIRIATNKVNMPYDSTIDGVSFLGKDRKTLTFYFKIAYIHVYKNVITVWLNFTLQSKDDGGISGMILLTASLNSDGTVNQDSVTVSSQSFSTLGTDDNYGIFLAKVVRVGSTQTFLATASNGTPPAIPDIPKSVVWVANDQGLMRRYFNEGYSLRSWVSRSESRNNLSTSQMYVGYSSNPNSNIIDPSSLSIYSTHNVQSIREDVLNDNVTGIIDSKYDNLGLHIPSGSTSFADAIPNPANVNIQNNVSAVKGGPYNGFQSANSVDCITAFGVPLRIAYTGNVTSTSSLRRLSIVLQYIKRTVSSNAKPSTVTGNFAKHWCDLISSKLNIEDTNDTPGAGTEGYHVIPALSCTGYTITGSTNIKNFMRFNTSGQPDYIYQCTVTPQSFNSLSNFDAGTGLTHSGLSPRNSYLFLAHGVTSDGYLISLNQQFHLESSSSVMKFDYISMKLNPIYEPLLPGVNNNLGAWSVN